MDKKDLAQDKKMVAGAVHKHEKKKVIPTYHIDGSRAKEYVPLTARMGDRSAKLEEKTAEIQLQFASLLQELQDKRGKDTTAQIAREVLADLSWAGDGVACAVRLSSGEVALQERVSELIARCCSELLLNFAELD